MQVLRLLLNSTASFACLYCCWIQPPRLHVFIVAEFNRLICMSSVDLFSMRAFFAFV
jgi:hypothetical protein